MENYSIYDEIGRGTHSFVYKARRKRSIEFVAVKSTAKCRMDKILNEVQLLHKLDSRYVLKFYNWYESQNHIWLIFEYCIGGDLLNLVTQDKSLPEPAVQYLHSNGILFCDLKPASILIDEFGSLKLADFGLARRIPTHETIASAPQLAPGSPNYMAPELFQQPAIHSFASDFWALGCLLYELCVGRQPFTHTNFSELARMIQTEELELPVSGCEMCPSFWALLERLLEKDPYRRISWDELVDHPFWTGLTPLAKVAMPEQALFTAANTAGRSRGPESALRPNASSSMSPSSDSKDARRDGTNAAERASLSAEPIASADRVTHNSNSSGSTTDAADDATSASSQDNDNDDASDDDDDGEDDDDASLQLLAGTKPALRPVSAPVNPTSFSTRSAPIDGKASDSSANEQSRAPAGRANRLEPTKQSDTRPAARGIVSTDHSRDRASPGLTVPRTAPPAPLTRRTTSAPSRRAVRFDGLFDRDGKLGGALKKPSKLIFTAADCAVKPIVYSNEIEAIAVPSVQPHDLRFALLAADELLSCSTEKLESHLKDVYVGLKASDASATERCSVLRHLFSLALHSKLANVIVNSSILSLLARLLASLTAASPSSDSVVALICLDLGVLFRFATFIAPSSPEQLQALVSTLARITQQPARDTQRRALASLGELLFYVATQKDWTFPTTGLARVVELLDAHDVVLRHYAVRTLCNLLVHCSSEALVPLLVNEHVALLLVNGLTQLATAHEPPVSVWTTTTQAIAQVMRHLQAPASSSSSSHVSPRVRTSVLLLVATPNVFDALWRGVASHEAAPELAIASLNVLNALLETNVTGRRGSGRAVQSGADDRSRDQAALDAANAALFASDVVSFRALAAILAARSRFEDDALRTSALSRDASAPVSGPQRRRYSQEAPGAPNLLRAKALLFLYYGAQTSKAFALTCIEQRHVDVVDRVLLPFAAHLQSETDAASSPSAGAASPSGRRLRAKLAPVDVYLLQCALNVIKASIRSALKLSAECIAAHDSDETLEDRAQSRATVSPAPFALLDALVQSHVCRAQLVRYFVANDANEFTFFVRLMTKLLVTFPTESLRRRSRSHARALDDRDTDDATSSVAVCVSEILLRLLQGSDSDVTALLSVERELVFTQLLPAVALQLHGLPASAAPLDAESDSEEDLHANCLRILYLALLHVDDDDSSTDAPRLRDALILDHVFPCVRALLTAGATATGNENVWRFTIELVYGLVARDERLVLALHSARLVAPVLALLRAPQQLDFHALPSSATKLVHVVVATTAATSPAHLDELYARGLAESLLAGLEFADAEMLVSSLVDLLDVLYQLLLSRYDTLRRAKAARSSPPRAPAPFDALVLAGPLVLKLCALPLREHVNQHDAHSPQPHESPSRDKRALRDERSESVSELASRCLVYLSQIFGAKLNDIVFAPAAAHRGDDAVATAVLTSLERHSPDGVVLLRVLLTLKNCVRCQSSSRVTAWLLGHAALHHRIRGIAATAKSAKALARDTSASSMREQIAKTASDIVRLCEAATSTGAPAPSS